MAPTCMDDCWEPLPPPLEARVLDAVRIICSRILERAEETVHRLDSIVIAEADQTGISFVRHVWKDIIEIARDVRRSIGEGAAWPI